jgi:hypothetical protein
VGELRAHKLGERTISPFILDQQIEARAQAPNSLAELRDELFHRACCGLVSDCLNDAQDVLGAMFDFAQQLLHLCLGAFALCNITDYRQYQPPLVDLNRAQHETVSPFSPPRPEP